MNETFFHPPNKLNLNVCLGNHNISIHENQKFGWVFFLYIGIYIPHSIISSQILHEWNIFSYPPKKLNFDWVLKKHIHPQRKRSSIWVCIGETTTFPSMKNVKINLRVAWRKVTFPLYKEIQFKLHCIVLNVLISYRNELVFCETRTFQQKNCFAKIFIYFSFFRCFLVLTQIRRIYCILHIGYIIIMLWLKFIYTKVISTCHVIDIWTCVV